jgi:hypothetical protein
MLILLVLCGFGVHRSCNDELTIQISSEYDCN